MSDVRAEQDAPTTGTPATTKRRSAAWVIPVAVTGASIVVILLLVLAQ